MWENQAIKILNKIQNGAHYLEIQSYVQLYIKSALFSYTCITTYKITLCEAKGKEERPSVANNCERVFPSHKLS